MEFDVSSATVKEAAKAINCKEGEIVKTLGSFQSFIRRMYSWNCSQKPAGPAR